MRTYYTEFTRHCLRYYIKTLDEGKGGCPRFRSDAERENWQACHLVLKDYPTDKLETIAYLYRPGDTIADKIYALAREKGVHQGTLWNLVGTVEQAIARKRGLV